jgi:hypothetical protein
MSSAFREFLAVVIPAPAGIPCDSLDPRPRFHEARPRAGMTAAAASENAHCSQDHRIAMNPLRPAVARIPAIHGLSKARRKS